MKTTNYLPFDKAIVIGFVLSFIIGFSSCKKTLIPNSQMLADYSIQQIAVDQTGPVNIYLAGWRSAYPDIEFATYCKNGVTADLTSGTSYIQANSIAVSGNDIYVGGNEYLNDHFIAMYWKNGSVKYLTDPSQTSYINVNSG